MTQAINETGGEHYTDLLFPFAYNILGTVDDAKDAVQDVLLKHYANAIAHVQDEKNYLIRSVINKAINLKTRQQKTIRPGLPWLPEPVATEDAADRNLHLRDLLSYSLMVLMEKLGATERAVFILHESFDYPYGEIAGILEISETYCRKLMSRARAKLFKPASMKRPGNDTREKVMLERFIAAIRQRDTRQLERLMAEDIRFYADSGGKVPLLATASAGFKAVAELQITIYHRFLSSAELVYISINHQPALLSFIKGRLRSCLVFDLNTETGKVLQINAILDPGKLKHLHR